MCDYHPLVNGYDIYGNHVFHIKYSWQYIWCLLYSTLSGLHWCKSHRGSRDENVEAEATHSQTSWASLWDIQAPRWASQYCGQLWTHQQGIFCCLINIYWKSFFHGYHCSINSENKMLTKRKISDVFCN